MNNVVILIVPAKGWLVWMRNTPTHHDYRNYKSVVRTYHPRTICAKQPLVFDKPVEQIWVPVLPGLISPKYTFCNLLLNQFKQLLLCCRLVNESKGLSDRPF